MTESFRVSYMGKVRALRLNNTELNDRTTKLIADDLKSPRKASAEKKAVLKEAIRISNKVNRP